MSYHGISCHTILEYNVLTKVKINMYKIYTWTYKFILSNYKLYDVKFIVDSMLGSLAKYLRFMGYDTYYVKSNVKDDEILEICKRENRILITRDYELSKKCDNSIYIDDIKLDKQIKFLIKKLNLNFDNALSRCSLCNTELIKIDKENVKDLVPINVYNSINEFYYCTNCKKVYWFGSHTKNIIKRLEEIKNDC